MLRKSLALGTCLAATLVVAGCADRTTAPVATAPRASMSVARDARSSLLESLRRNGTSAFGSAADLSFSAGDRAINPSDYLCSSTSPIIDWLNGAISNTVNASPEESARYTTLYNNFADLVPTYEAVLFQTRATPQYYGYTGRFTKAIVKVERDVKKFWDIPSSEIQVLAMHGDVLLDVARTARTYQALGLPRPLALLWATQNRDAVLHSTTMVNGNHPLWTFNAVSFSAPELGLPNKIVMGDGILEGFSAIGFGDVAPQAIFAHEFAHQLQFYHHYGLAGASAPEQSRYNELMADAFAAYFLTHARGAAMNQKRVEQFLSVFHQIGDCTFTSDIHHGTPNQRLAAARFGFKVADEARKQGHILTSAQFFARFQKQYPTLIAPDAVAAR